MGGCWEIPRTAGTGNISRRIHRCKYLVFAFAKFTFPLNNPIVIIVKKPTPHDWHQVWNKLDKTLPGLTATDMDFVKQAVDEIVQRLIRRTERDYDEVVAAMRGAGIPVPLHSAIRHVKVSMSAQEKSNFAGEGIALQEFPSNHAEATGV